MNKVKANKIDIIVPYYYTDDNFLLFDAMMHSILMQSITNLINIIIIDDNPNKGTKGEMDFSYSILEYRNCYKDIYVIKNEKNLGVGKSRQIGLDSSSSKYVMFVDADDTLSSYYSVELMYNFMESNKRCGLLSGQFEEEVNKFEYITHSQDLTWIFGKMYRRSFIKKYNASFIDSSANEDSGFNGILSFSARSEEIVFFDKIVYNWRYNKESITRNHSIPYLYGPSFYGYILNSIFVYKISCYNIDNKITKKTEKDLNDFILNILAFVYYYYLNMVKNKQFNDEAKNSLKALGNEMVKDYISRYNQIDYTNLSNSFTFVNNIALRLFGNIEPSASFEEFLSLL